MADSGESNELITDAAMELIKEDEAGEGPRWHKQVSLSSLILALLAALAGLLAGLSASQELHERTQEIMELSRLQGDRVHVQVLRTKHELLDSLGRPVDPAELAEIQTYEEEETALLSEIAAEELHGQRVSSSYIILAVAVMLLSVGITLCGMAVVADDKRLWIAGLAIGAVGFLALVVGIVRMLV